MTEFEAATVAYQQAALALQQQQFWAAVAIPLVAGLVGLGQILVVLRGIRVMDAANQDRARQIEAQIEAQRRQAEAQHSQAEAQRRQAEAQYNQIEAQTEAQRRQAEAQHSQIEAQMEAQRRQAEAQRAEADQRHAEAMEALRQQGESLRVLVKSMEAVIERTAPRQ